MSRIILVVFSALTLTSCPEDREEPEEDEPHPLEGIYAASAHTEAAPCDVTPAPPANPVTRFKLAESSFFFMKVLGFFDCSATLDPNLEELDGDGCSTSMNLNLTGIPPDDHVEITSCSCFEGTCAVSGTDGAWTKSGDTVELVVDRRSGDVSGDEGPDGCDPSALFQEHKDVLTCEQRTRIAGTQE